MLPYVLAETTTTSSGEFFFFFFFLFFPIFSCWIKSGDQLHEDLAKSGYKTRKEVENFGILNCMLENQWNLLLAKCGDFKRRKLETCPPPPTSLKYDNFFGIFSKSSLDQVAWDLFFCSNMANFCHKKITGSQQLLRLSLSSSVQLSPSISLFLS